MPYNYAIVPEILTNKEILRKAEPLLVPAIVVLIGISSFGLGRLSAVGEERPVVSVQTSGTYVASKSGDKYYWPSCSAVARIKDENKVWFASAAEAKAAGYTPGANCPGL